MSKELTIEQRHLIDAEAVAKEFEEGRLAEEEWRKKTAPARAPKPAEPAKPKITTAELKQLGDAFDAASDRGDTDEMRRLLGKMHKTTGNFKAWTVWCLRIHVTERKRLIARIEALESQEKQFRYRGVFQPAEDYRRNNSVTYDGSLWIAVKDAPGKPGVDGWQLAAKRGADAR